MISRLFYIFIILSVVYAYNRKTEELSTYEKFMEKNLMTTMRLTGPCIEIDGKLVPDVKASLKDLYHCTYVRNFDFMHLRNLYTDRCIYGTKYRV